MDKKIKIDYFVQGQLEKLYITSLSLTSYL